MKIRIIVVCAVFSSHAIATDSTEPPALQRWQAEAVVNLVFNRLDCDLDGTIEQAEVDEHIGQLWHPIDLDQSRALDRHEYSLTHRTVDEQSAERLFRDADTNHDDKVSVNEFRAHLKRMIRQVDDDGDREVHRADVGLKPWPTPFAHRTRLSGTDSE